MYFVQSERRLEEIILTKKSILIYGTGLVGTFVYKRIVSLGMADRIKGFIKTQADEHERYLNYPVYSVSEITEDTEMIILICAISKIRNEMLQTLNDFEIYSYIPITETLYEDMESCYISEKIKDVEGEYDIVMCSQDNNLSSGAFISMSCLCEEVHKLSDLHILVILQRYGDGEQLLEEKKIDYVYAKSSKGWIHSDDNESMDDFVVNESEIDYFEYIIRKSKVKLVHMSGMFVYAGAMAANRIGIPVVWHIRENIYTQGNDFISPKWAYKLINKSSYVIGTSIHTLEAYQGIENVNACIIYNGADEEQFYMDREIFNSELVEVVMVGHITRLKGQEIIIKALSIIKDKGYPIPHITLVGSGDSTYIEYLRAEINSLGVKDFVTFAGRTDVSQNYYHKADIAISATSGGEGFDRVRIEAMLSGCLLMTNDMGAARECVSHGETGYIYKDGDAKQLAELIVHAMGNIGESRRIAHRGQEYCRNNFTKEKNAKEVLKIYKRILEE